MQYFGKLYGRFGRKYFPLEMTGADVEALERRLANAPIIRVGMIVEIQGFLCKVESTSLSSATRTHKQEIGIGLKIISEAF